MDGYELPQTAAGVPAPWVDPLVDELALIDTAAAAYNWIGMSPALRLALSQALGSAEPRLRDVVYIPEAAWQALVTALRVAVPDVEEVAQPPREPTPVELGHLVALRRIARLRLGLTAVAARPAVQIAGGPGVGVQVAGSTALIIPDAVAGSGGGSAEPKLKLSLVLDPALDSDLQRLPPFEVRKLYDKYAAARGDEPAEDIEPTLEQISAVAQVTKADLAPYACFSLFGPHGRRMLQKLVSCAWAFLPNGTWQRRELPGPPNFEHWWASFRVLRVVYLLLDITDAETIDNYGELLRSFANTYGETAWFVVYTADVRMRSEQFDRLRRRAEREHADKVAQNVPSDFDPARPWKKVIRRALGDRNWWDENLHRPALLFLTRVRTAAISVDDGTVQPALDDSSRNGSGCAKTAEVVTARGSQAASSSEVQKLKASGEGRSNGFFRATLEAYT